MLIDLGVTGASIAACSRVRRASDVQQFPAKKDKTVTVDVGRFDRNLDVAAHYGLTEHFGGGVPSVLIVDPRSDALLPKGRTAALRTHAH